MGGHFSSRASAGSDSAQSPRSPPPSFHGSHAASSASHLPHSNPAYPDPQLSTASHAYSPTTTNGHQQSYYQRTLPSGFPPSVPRHLTPATSSSSETPPRDPRNGQWAQQQQQQQLQSHQHHHYISPTSSSSFAGQSSDRYVCSRCNKAFSRPSSLRIHTHSHTGEKPFICPHKNCGKAFSVRSNMKRHERGCHGGGSLES